VTAVIGTAGHIDHGKTALLRALTGIDADRLPDERRRGMTLDVGYAHLRLDDGSEIDFVDVPGHDRLIGNMLVGAGEIDAAMLIVAADDGPRAQTIEHLELLDALRIDDGIAVVTKADAVAPDRTTAVMAQVRSMLAPTSLCGVPVVEVSSTTGAGLDALRAELVILQRRLLTGRRAIGPARLAIDRAFSVRGRGVVVTGSLRGGPVARGDVLRVEPVGLEARVREIQVHNRSVDRAEGGGRVALNLAGVDSDALRRGLVLTSGPGVERTERLLVVLAKTQPDRLRHGLAVRLHIGTDQADGRLDLGRRASVITADGRVTAIVQLERPIAASFGNAFVLRRPSPGETLAGGRILDPLPPRGVSRRRMTPGALADLAGAEWGTMQQWESLLALHGALPSAREEAWIVALGGPAPEARMSVTVAPDVERALEGFALELVGAAGRVPIAEFREALAADLRRRVTLERTLVTSVINALLDGFAAGGRLVRDGDRVSPAGVATGPGADLIAAMDRLEAALAVPTPPSLREAAAAARCSTEGIRVLEAADRIVRVEDDLAWEAGTLRRFVALAFEMASRGPLLPAAFRDATGTSRRYALAILEDLDRQGLLRRTPAGHVPGPRARSGAPAPAAVNR
jgi:selenocysteine-specific elongation factor